MVSPSTLGVFHAQEIGAKPGKAPRGLAPAIMASLFATELAAVEQFDADEACVPLRIRFPPQPPLLPIRSLPQTLH